MDIEQLNISAYKEARLERDNQVKDVLKRSYQTIEYCEQNLKKAREAHERLISDFQAGNFDVEEPCTAGSR